MRFFVKKYSNNMAVKVAVVLLLIFATLLPASLYAQTHSPIELNFGQGADATAVECPIVDNSFTANIMRCAMTIMDEMADKHIEKVVDLMQGFVSTLGILAIVIFGYRAMFGGVKIRGEAALLALKFAMVMYFATNDGLLEFRKVIIGFGLGLGNVFTTMMGVWKDSTLATALIMSPDIAVPAIKIASVFPNTFDDTMESGGGRYIASKDLSLFNELDSTIRVILGIDSQYGFMAWSILITLTFLGGPIGLMIAIFMLSLVMTLIVACVQICYIFILSMFGTTFLMALGPLFIPLALFNSTKGIFQTWLAWIISLALQPALLVIFLSMTLLVMQWALITPLTNIYNDMFATMQSENSSKSMKLMEGIQQQTPANYERDFQPVPQGIQDTVDANVRLFGEWTNTAGMVGNMSNRTVRSFSKGEDWKLVKVGLGNFGGYKLEQTGADVTEISGIMSTGLHVPNLAWSRSKKLGVVAILAVGFMMFMFMVSVQKDIPKLAHDLVGNRQVAALGQFAAPITGATAKVRKAMRKAGGGEK